MSKIRIILISPLFILGFIPIGCILAIVPLFIQAELGSRKSTQRFKNLQLGMSMEDVRLKMGEPQAIDSLDFGREQWNLRIPFGASESPRCYFDLDEDELVWMYWRDWGISTGHDIDSTNAPHEECVFESSSWQQGNASERGLMINDLISSELLIGKSMPEVEALLGPPDGRYYSSFRYQIDLGHTLLGKPYTYELLTLFRVSPTKVREVLLVPIWP